MVSLPSDILDSAFRQQDKNEDDALGNDIRQQVQTAQRTPTFSLPSLDSLLGGGNQPATASTDPSEAPQASGWKLPDLSSLLGNTPEPSRTNNLGTPTTVASTQPAAAMPSGAATAMPSAMPQGAGAPPGTGEIETYIRQAAARRRIDPDTAIRVALSEGGLDDPVRQSDVVYQGRREQSYGPLQLNVEGGVGSAALRAGIDPRDPSKWREAIDFGLDEVARAGWGQWHGAARVGIGNRQGIGVDVPVPSGAPQPRQSAAPAAGAMVTYTDPWGNEFTDTEERFNQRPGGTADVKVVRRTQAAPQSAAMPEQASQAYAAGSYTPNQITAATGEGLDYETALAVCGPAAAIAFARKNGRNPTMQEAVGLAREVGWTAQRGMAGPGSQQRLLQSMGVAARLAAGAPDWKTVAADVQRGNPVIISTPGHYFVAERYDPESGSFDFGQSAGVLKASRGRTWFRPEELPGLNMGAPSASLFMDSPQSPTPSVVAGRSTPNAAGQPPAAASPPSAPAGSAPPPAGASPLDEARSTLGSASSGDMQRQPLSAQPELPADDGAGYVDPDAGPREGGRGYNLSVGAVAPAGAPADPLPLSSNGATAPYGPDLPPVSQAQAEEEVQSASRQVPPLSPYDTDQPFRPTPRLGSPPAGPASLPVAQAPSQDRGYDPRDADQGLHETPQYVPPETWYGRAAETAIRTLEPALAAYNAANEWFINNPITGSLNPQAWGREIAGTEQLYLETREDQQRLEALIRRFRAGDTAVEPEIQALTASLNRRTQADRGSMLAAGERNPDKTAETLGQVVQAGAALAIAPGLAAGPVRNVVAGALDPIGQGIGAGVEGAVRGARAAAPVVRSGAEAAGQRVRGALTANAERTAAADARMTQQPSVTAPGALGVAMGTDAQPMVRGRVIPPEVADELDFPLRPPTDPRHIRAIEAAGGTVDERGVTVNTIRNQGERAAGGVATRGSVFYIAGPKGAPNPWASSVADPKGTGGPQRIEGETRFRSPMILDDAPGDNAGFDQGMRQLGTGPNKAEIDAAFDEVGRLGDQIRELDRGGMVRVTPREYNRLQDAYSEAKRHLDGLSEGAATGSNIDRAIREARAAGPEGSPARAQALRDLVSRYGGDPELVDASLAVRGGDASEGVWTIKENILMANARRGGHDGVLVVQTQGADEAAVSAHPKVVAAAQAVDEASRAQSAAFRESDGLRGDPAAHYAAVQRYKAASEETERLDQQYLRVLEDARAELGGHRITELADPREKLNPTPGAPNPVLVAVRTRLDEAKRLQTDAMAARKQAVEAGDDAADASAQSAYNRAREQRIEALEEIARLTEGNDLAGPPGYTLRSDIPRRPDAAAPTSTIAENPRLVAAEQAYKDASAREGQLYDQFLKAQDRDPVAYNTYDAWAQKTGNREAAEAKDAVSRTYAAYQEALGSGPRYTTASASAGALPATRGSGALSTVNRAASEAIVGGTGGAVIEQARNPDEDPRTAAARGFAAGAVGFPIAGRLARGAARAAGRETGASGALAALGNVPPGSNGANLLSAFPRVAEWAARQKGKNVAEMAAKGITPASKVEIVRETIGTVGYGSMLGPGTATFQLAVGLMQPAWAALKEPTRAVYRAGKTGNLSALKEPAAAAGGAVIATKKLGDAVWDVIRARGAYAPNPDAPMLSQRLADPFGKALMQALETPGRVWSSLPDAIFGTYTQHMVEARRAAQLATDAGHTGEKWQEWVDLYLKEAERVRTTGSKQVSDETADVIASGQTAAERAAMRRELGSVGRVVQTVARGGGAPVLGNFLSPFFKGQWNAFLQQAERSPVGLVMNTQSKSWKSPSFDKVYDAMVGSAAIYALAESARQGVVTVNGSGPTNPNERQAWIDQGNRPYSIKIGDVFIPNRMLGHAEGALNAVGELNDSIKYQKEGADARWLSEAALARVGKLLKQQPYANGYSTIADTIQFGPAALVADLGTRFTPAGSTLRAIGTAGDDSERTVDRGDGVPLETEAYQRWQQGTGQREGLPVAQDILGRPKENQQQGAAAFFGKLGYAKDDPIISVFQEARIFPGDPPDDIRGIKLTPAEKRQWDTYRGEALRDLIPDVAEDIRAEDPSIREKILRRTLGQAGQIARGRTIEAMGDDFERRLEATLEPAGVGR